MRSHALIITLCSVALAACAGGQPPSPEQRAAAADDLNPSGRPYVGPAPLRSSFPPADTSFTPLDCRIEGPGTVCARSTN